MLIQISSGRGPEECELAVSMFLKVLEKELENSETLSYESGRYRDCYKSVLIRTDSPLNFSEGTVQWISRSPFRPNYSRKNWFIKVSFIDEPQNSTYEVEKNFIFQTFRSGGKGGQYVNKTESGIRAIHAATGLCAISTDERSQYLNKKIAAKRLNALLEKENAAEESQLYKTLQSNHNNLSRGNPIRIYKGTSFIKVENKSE